MSDFLFYKWILSLVLFSLFLFSFNAYALTLSVVTEEAISLQYKSKTTNKMAGPADNLVEKVINAAGVDFTTKVLPWTRIYKQAEQIKNT